MKATKQPRWRKKTDKEQFERFVAAARKLGVNEKHGRFSGQVSKDRAAETGSKKNMTWNQCVAFSSASRTNKFVPLSPPIWPLILLIRSTT